MTIKRSGSWSDSQTNTTAFTSAEEAWFWFIDAQEARNSGARIMAGAGLYNRPCEPVDILKILDRLYRTRRLLRDHLLVLRHYGRRKMAPDARRAKEKRAATLWKEALSILEDSLVAKNIVIRLDYPPSNTWHEKAMLYENTYMDKLAGGAHEG